MSKEKILQLISELPESFLDAEPSEIKNYFKKKCPYEIQESINLLAAHYLLSQVPLNDNWYHNFKHAKAFLENKYKQIWNGEENDLLNCIEICHSALIKNKIVTGIFNQ